MLRVAVAGASSLGKSTLAESVANHLGLDIISQDDFYRPVTEIPVLPDGRPNLDSPDSFDHQAYLRALSQCANKLGFVAEGLFAFYQAPEEFSHRILLEGPLRLTYERRQKGYENDPVYLYVIESMKRHIDKQRTDASLVIEMDESTTKADVLAQALEHIRNGREGMA